MKKMLILACMAIGIVACGKDDEKGQILSPSGNHMVKSIKAAIYEDGFCKDSSVSSYAYDSFGRVVSMKTDYKWGDSSFSKMTNITYNGDEFFVSEGWIDEDVSISFSGDLNSDGYITRIWDEVYPCSLQYDSDGHYVSGVYDDGDRDKQSYSWHEGNIVHEVTAYDWGSYESMMKYNDVPAKNVNLDLSRFVLAKSMQVCCFAFGDSDNIASVCIPLYGVNNSNIVESCMDDDACYCTYQWSYNKKGLPTSCTAKYGSNDSDPALDYEIVFEFSYM